MANAKREFAQYKRYTKLTENLIRMISILDMAEVAIQNVDGTLENAGLLAAVSSGIRQQMKGASVEKVQAVRDEYQEAVDEANEIAEEISQPMGDDIGIDEDFEEFEREVEEEEAKERGQEAANIPKLPAAGEKQPVAAA